MQREHKQELYGDKKSAEKKAVWTWDKDEFAWYYNWAIHTINRVKFTGERWLSGSGYGWEKIYQYECLSSSDNRHFDRSDARISHGEEFYFFEDLESARTQALGHIQRMRDMENEKFDRQVNDVLSYYQKQTTYERSILTEKIISDVRDN